MIPGNLEPFAERSEAYVHGLITLGDDERISLWEYIGRAKVRTTQAMRGQASLPLRIWPRSFYDHIIRDEKDFLEFLTTPFPCEGREDEDRSSQRQP